MVLQTDKFIYIMEFKLNGTAEEALQQINDKHYARPFETDSRKLFKIGVNFSAETRNIEKWLVENWIACAGNKIFISHILIDLI